MKGELVQSLKKRVEEVAKSMSDPDRQFNYGKELFTVKEVLPLSENTAYFIFEKQPSKKLALAMFLYINGGEGFWIHFFPRYDHIAGMQRINDLLLRIEQANFDKNG